MTGAPASGGVLHREARRGVNTASFEVPGGRPEKVPMVPHCLSSAKSRVKDGAEWSLDRKKLAGFDLCRTGTLKITG